MTTIKALVVPEWLFELGVRVFKWDTLTAMTDSTSEISLSIIQDQTHRLVDARSDETARAFGAPYYSDKRRTWK